MSFFKQNIALYIALTLIWVLAGCSHIREYPITEPITFDPDNAHVTQIPEERAPNYIWDAVYYAIFHPVLDSIDNLFGLLGPGEAKNVNSLGEVPNSSWFTNRIGMYPMTPEEVARGPCTTPCPSQDGHWIVTRGKTQGVTPGFFIEDALGDAYIVKFDPPQAPEGSSAADIISSRFLHAAGYNVPEDSIVYFDPKILKVSPNAKFTDRKGQKRRMTQADLDVILRYPMREPDGRIRAFTSKLLSGKPVGPFDYSGKRSDDPNDIIPHQDRRELRGLIAISAFLNHGDMRGPNSLDMYVTENGKNYVKHYLIDFGSTLGVDGLGPKKPFKGFAYLVDFRDILLNIFTLGLYIYPWEKIELPDIKGAGSFEADAYSSGNWKPDYPNAALMHATNLDGYWGAKIVMAFTDEHIKTIVKEAKYSDPRAEEYMIRTLIKRRDKTGRYWYNKVNPLDRFKVDKNVLRFDDMAVVGHLEKVEDTKYKWKLEYHGNEIQPLTDYVEIDSTQITFAPDIIEKMNDAIQQSGNPNNPRNHVFSINIRTKRANRQKWSKSVCPYIYYSPEDDLKLIGIVPCLGQAHIGPECTPPKRSVSQKALWPVTFTLKLPAQILRYTSKSIIVGIDESTIIPTYRGVAFNEMESIGLYPMPYLSPDSGLGGGFAFFYDDFLSPGMDLKVKANLTTALQHGAELSLKKPKWMNNRFYTNLLLKYDYDPDRHFHGIGFDSDKKNRTNFSLRTVNTKVDFGVNVMPTIHLGGNLGYVWADNGPGREKDYPSIGETPEKNPIPNAFDETLSFLVPQFSLVHDNAMPAGRPRSGGREEFTVSLYQELTDKKFRFIHYELQLSRYIHLLLERTLAARVRVEVSLPIGEEHEVPFFLLSQLGGSDTLRGYNTGRFYDKDLVLATLEYRFPVWRYPFPVHTYQVDGRVFMDAGRVFNDIFDDLTLKHTKLSGGFGLRFSTKEDFIFRFEIAKSSEQLCTIFEQKVVF